MAAPDGYEALLPDGEKNTEEDSACEGRTCARENQYDPCNLYSIFILKGVAIWRTNAILQTEKFINTRKDSAAMNWNFEKNSSSKNFILSSVFWLILFTTFGFIAAIKFFAPEFLAQTSYLTFGIVRPMHVNGVTFGFLSTGLKEQRIILLRSLQVRTFTVRNWET